MKFEIWSKYGEFVGYLENNDLDSIRSYSVFTKHPGYNAWEIRIANIKYGEIKSIYVPSVTGIINLYYIKESK